MKTDTKAYSQTDRQINRQTYRQTDKKIDRQTERHKETQINRQTVRHTDKQTDKQKNIRKKTVFVEYIFFIFQRNVVQQISKEKTKQKI